MNASAARRAALPLDVVRWCPSCADDVFLERPDCADEHGADCPERVCVRCGDALFVYFALPLVELPFQAFEFIEEPS
jgi:hypothetical protein